MTVTYSVSGMMEWVAVIPTRSNLLRVRFSGGSLSGYGVTPATFTTSNPVVIRMIEDSRLFKSGKIKRYKTSGSSSVSASHSSEGKAVGREEGDMTMTPIKKKR